MSETTPSQSLEETLNKTDLGHVIYEKKNLIAALLLALLIAVIGWMSYTNFKTMQQKKGSQMVFEFQNETWEKVKAGSLSADDLVSKVQGLENVAKSSASFLPLSLEMSKFLAEKGQADKALALLDEVKPENELARFFVGHQKAVLLEGQGKIDEAISVVEGLKKSKEALMPAHLELLLGRLYFAKKDFNQAKSVFESIVNNYPQDEEAKLAKLYLGEMK